MVRKLDEVFEFKGQTFQVKASLSCEDCYFFKYYPDCSHPPIRDVIGSCCHMYRSDHTSVIFKKVE